MRNILEGNNPILKNFLFLSLLLLLLQGCLSTRPFVAAEQPNAPDYNNQKNWCALPFRKDMADMIPASEKWISDSIKPVDVFYVYPTLYLSGRTWNVSVEKKRLNKRIDKYPVKYQASVFNKIGRVYAPRYRQARIGSFIDTTGNGEKALDFAYQDIKKAFEFYLSHYNNGRPIIIASHSQGTMLCRRLIKEFFDTPETKKKLVCAYIVGYAVDSTIYTVLTPCREPGEVNCFVTWSSFTSPYRGTGLKSHTLNEMSVNPITWKMDSIKANGEGGIILKLNKKKRFKAEVQVAENNLWVTTDAPFFKHIRNLHVLDYNLFWYDIRKNADLRVGEYLKKN